MLDVSSVLDACETLSDTVHVGVDEFDAVMLAIVLEIDRDVDAVDDIVMEFDPVSEMLSVREASREDEAESVNDADDETEISFDNDTDDDMTGDVETDTVQLADCDKVRVHENDGVKEPIDKVRDAVSESDSSCVKVTE